MTLKVKVQGLIDQAFEEYTDLFLIDFTISADNKIVVIIDGDQGVTLQNCIDVSRAIEHNLDREEEDFALEVASAGAAAPLKLLRQYPKNIGRKLKVITTEQEKIEATLESVGDDSIVLKWKAREPKPIGKGKVTVEKEAIIPFDKIKEASVIISF
ncbi:MULTISPECIES: ribosome assembly cofactor RimP [Myroides]|uniref:Ribosome maturation factor RimP n=1 Tax=Myroides albus TaxID=2562892 RepID=A0A6I3LEU9_9FLAO|nr:MULTISPECIES: ribosome assembly cofactor RimP [Myroides]MTG96733.1 ribosome assembly cofactor RimP [Myroides albus]MVX35625.1 ribosome assembly cofactor RimP [Myroides sp. LoEW2-1]UVD80855.1 ribosome assembly cofactor RimP [Myroides albus]